MAHVQPELAAVEWTLGGKWDGLTWHAPTLDEELTPDLEEAALATLRYVQTDLCGFEAPLEPETARTLMRDRRNALLALIERYAPKRTKELQLEQTDGEPLTVCIGHAHAIRYPGDARWKKKTVPVWLNEGADGLTHVGFTVAGCRSVFPDCRRTTGGNMWPWFCEECKGERRHPARDQGRKLRAKLNRMRRGEGATVYESSFHIATGDGEET